MSNATLKSRNFLRVARLAIPLISLATLGLGSPRPPGDRPPTSEELDFARMVGNHRGDPGLIHDVRTRELRTPLAKSGWTPQELQRITAFPSPDAVPDAIVVLLGFTDSPAPQLPAVVPMDQLGAGAGSQIFNCRLKVSRASLTPPTPRAANRAKAIRILVRLIDRDLASNPAYKTALAKVKEGSRTFILVTEPKPDDVGNFWNGYDWLPPFPVEVSSGRKINRIGLLAVPR